ncbi:MAG: valine--tRNA ligase [Simkaniaceae bacterium]
MGDLNKPYDPKPVEEFWSGFWEERSYFQADAHSEKEPFCLVLPPPNVTGVLHMGHALVDTLQDIVARYRRMQGKEVLWVPGCDHAGIATQTVVERHLIKTLGKRRVDMDRDEFLTHVYAWKEKSEKEILSQIRKVGCSLDFSRYRFTMDEASSHAVKVCFKKLYDEGLIYRGDYLVNWDPVTMTALADDEVEYEEQESSLWYINYPLEKGEGSIQIATTRPETLLGDVAVAVNPKDERYKALIGQNLILPLQNRKIPIIGDSYVDKEFGTGAVKITPAHDPNDHAMGFRHSLPLINILTPDGKINHEGGSFEGLDINQARIAIVEALKENHFLAKIEPYTHRVGVSYRSKAAIQPYLSKQWFIKMDSFKKKLKQAVSEKKVKLIPDWDKTYFHWIDHLRDWCISRQLFWGHQIPVYYNKKDPSMEVCSLDPLPSDEWEQDPDVLDTWFSSALWPFSTLGWPEKSADLKKFYPNATLITGHDILFFWVARMIMMGEYIMGEVPFKETFIHGLIFGKSYWREEKDGSITYVSSEEKKRYDLGEKLPKGVLSKWEKMSKSKGNVIDPLEIINTYGADAMRMALSSSVTHARQIDLDRRKFEEYKNFANKIWNGSRFVFTHIEDLSDSTPLDFNNLQLEDHWILSRLNYAIDSMNRFICAYEFDKAASLIYAFFWDEFCAYYLEIVKPTLFGKEGEPNSRIIKQKILTLVLTHFLLLSHPIAPFITEELFQKLKKLSPQFDPYLTSVFNTESLTLAPFPNRPYPSNESCEEAFSYINEIVYTIRNIRAEMALPPQAKSSLYFIGENLDRIETNQHIIKALIRTDALYFGARPKEQGLHSTQFIRGIEITIPMPDEFIEKELKRLEKEKLRLEKQLESLKNQLANENFIKRAPEELITKCNKNLEEAKKSLQSINKQLDKKHN